MNDSGNRPRPLEERPPSLLKASWALAGTLLLALVLGASSASARPCASMRAHVAATKTDRLFSHGEPQQRPASAGSLVSDRFPVRVHYADEVLEARAETVLGLVEDAWERLVVDMGFPAPLPDHGEGGDDRLDVYLGLVSPASAITVAGTDVDPDDGARRSYAYVLLDPGIPADDLPVFVHHELAHVVQFGTDLDATLMFAEASAVAYERLALPEETSWAQDLEDFQDWPNAPLFTNGIDFRPFAGADTFYEFGAALFLLYLEQEHGDFDGTLLRRLWLAGSQHDDAPRNQPDWLDALAAEVEVPVGDLVLDFASWRALVGSWAVPDDGLVGAGTLPANTRLFAKHLTPAVLDGRALSLSAADMPFQLGCATFQVEALSEALPVGVSARSLGGEGEEAPRPLGLAWVSGDPDRELARRGRHGSVGEELEVEATLAPRETAIFAVCDLGPAAADDLPSPTPVEVRVRRLDVDFPDAGPPPSDAGSVAADGGPGEDPPGCACQATPVREGSQAPFAAARPWAMGLLSLGGLVLFLVRGRRITRRRSLYKKDSERRR